MRFVLVQLEGQHLYSRSGVEASRWDYVTVQSREETDECSDPQVHVVAKADGRTGRGIYKGYAEVKCG